MTYIPHTPEEVQEMLQAIGVQKLDDLFSTIPNSLQIKELNLPDELSEQDVLKKMENLAGKNWVPELSFLGAGAYEHYIPAVVDQLVSRGEFYTAYTPYQPEASQGTLQAIYEYQSLMCQLTGMDVSNASLYDGATALAESLLVAYHATERKNFLVSKLVHPEYRLVLKTYIQAMGGHLIEIPWKEDGTTDLDFARQKLGSDVAAVCIQNPNFFGCIEDLSAFSEEAHRHEALMIGCVNPISLGLLTPPGECGADIACGEGQPLGNTISFGGPYLGFFTCREKWLRKVPGRLVGQTVDRSGRRAFVLTLQAREQHIRREKATSNICTNQSLNALTACVYLCAVGKEGLRQIATLNVLRSHSLSEKLSKIRGCGMKFSAPFFNEFVLQIPTSARDILAELQKQNILGGLDLSVYEPEMRNSLLVCATETKTDEDLNAYKKALTGIFKGSPKSKKRK